MFSQDGSDLATRLCPASSIAGRGVVLSSGIESLDQLLPGGGVLRGGLSELSGGRSCGKRSIAAALCWQALVRAQRAVWIDGCGGFYPLSALEHDVQRQGLIVVRAAAPSCSQPRRCPQVIQAADILLQAGRAVPLLVIDLPARIRLLPRWLSRLRLAAESSATALVFITEQESSVPHVSLGTFIDLQLLVRRVGPYRCSVRVAKSRRGQMARQAMVAIDAPHSLRLDTTL